MVGWLKGLKWHFCMSNSIDRLLKNYINARKSWEVWCFMSGLNNELKQEFIATKLKVDDSPLLTHLRYLAMKDYHIELYKVLKKSTNNKDNIFTILEKRVRSNPKNKLELEEALQLLIDDIDIITDHCNIRDKFYAHLDKKYEDYTSKKSYVVDTGNLFYLVEKAIIALTSDERLKQELAKIESRDDYHFSTIL